MNLFTPGNHTVKAGAKPTAPSEGTPKKRPGPGPVAKAGPQSASQSKNTQAQSNSWVAGAPTREGNSLLGTHVNEAVSIQTAAMGEMLRSYAQDATDVLDKTARVLYDHPESGSGSGAGPYTSVGLSSMATPEFHSSSHGHGQYVPSSSHDYLYSTYAHPYQPPDMNINMMATALAYPGSATAHAASLPYTYALPTQAQAQAQAHIAMHPAMSYNLLDPYGSVSYPTSGMQGMQGMHGMHGMQGMQQHHGMPNAMQSMQGMQSMPAWAGNGYPGSGVNHNHPMYAAQHMQTYPHAAFNSPSAGGMALPSLVESPDKKTGKGKGKSKRDGKSSKSKSKKEKSTDNSDDDDDNDDIDNGDADGDEGREADAAQNQINDAQLPAENEENGKGEEDGASLGTRPSTAASVSSIESSLASTSAETGKKDRHKSKDRSKSAERKEKKKKKKASTSREPDSLSIAKQAKMEHLMEVERQKRELAFQDMSKELREDLRHLREKYDNIVKFDASIHISLAEHQARFKVKQDECDHYVDSKLYEKQKAFDREVAEIKVEAKRTEDNYIATMDTYKDVVTKLDAECHKLEEGWHATKEQFAAYKAEKEEAHTAKLADLAAIQAQQENSLEALRKEHADDIKRMTEEAASKAEAYRLQEDECKRVKAANVEKIAINAKLGEEIKSVRDDMQNVKEKAIGTMQQLKEMTADKVAAEMQIERLKNAAAQLNKDLVTANDKYNDIVKWAQKLEETQKKHDAQLKEDMHRQHEKFNVEYDFLNKQNSALKDELRNLKHENNDNKSLLENALDTLKNLHRDNDDKNMKAIIFQERAEKAESLVARFDAKEAKNKEAADVLLEKELREQRNRFQEVADLQTKQLEIKVHVIEEMENKTNYLRTKINGLQDELQQRNRKIVVLEEQLMFENRMREINMQKRAEHENGGIDAIVQLLRINETNNANLDRLTENNTANLLTVRGDIAKLVSKMSSGSSSKDKAKKDAMNKLKAVGDLAGKSSSSSKRSGDKSRRKARSASPTPTRPVDMSKVRNMLFPGDEEAEQAAAAAAAAAEGGNTSTTTSSSQSAPAPAPTVKFKDGFGNVIDDPFRPLPTDSVAGAASVHGHAIQEKEKVADKSKDKENVKKNAAAANAIDKEEKENEKGKEKVKAGAKKAPSGDSASSAPAPTLNDKEASPARSASHNRSPSSERKSQQLDDKDKSRDRERSRERSRDRDKDKVKDKGSRDRSTSREGRSRGREKEAGPPSEGKREVKK